MVPQVLRGSESELDEGLDFAAAGDTDVNKRGVGRERESRYRYGRKTRSLDGVAEEVDITAATLGSLLLLIGLGGIGVLEAVGNRYTHSRCHNNEVDLPSDDPSLTHGGR